MQENRRGVSSEHTVDFEVTKFFNTNNSKMVQDSYT